MELENYLKAVLSHISDRTKRRAVSDELRCHIEDKTEYYIESGIDEQAARERAIESMGSADIVGEQLNRMYSRKPATICMIIIVAVYCVHFFFFMPASVLAWDALFFAVINEIFFAVTSFFGLYAANKLKRIYLLLPSLVINSLYMSQKVYFSSSALIYGTIAMLTGNVQNFGIALCLEQAKPGDNPVMTALVIFFTVSVLLLYVLSVVNIIRFRIRKYSLKDVRRDTAIKRFTAFMLAMVLLFPVVLCESANMSVKKTPINFEGVLIYASDTIPEPDKINIEGGDLLEIDYDWGSNWTDTESENIINDEMLYSEDSYDPFLSYEVDTMYCRYKTDKRYVTVIPCDFDYNLLTEQATCFDTESTTTLKGELNNTYLSEFRYKIEIEKL